MEKAITITRSDIIVAAGMTGFEFCDKAAEIWGDGKIEDDEWNKITDIVLLHIKLLTDCLFENFEESSTKRRSFKKEILRASRLKDEKEISMSINQTCMGMLSEITKFLTPIGGEEIPFVTGSLRYLEEELSKNAGDDESREAAEKVYEILKRNVKTEITVKKNGFC